MARQRQLVTSIRRTPEAHCLITAARSDSGAVGRPRSPPYRGRCRLRTRTQRPEVADQIRPV